MLDLLVHAPLPLLEDVPPAAVVGVGTGDGAPDLHLDNGEVFAHVPPAGGHKFLHVFRVGFAELVFGVGAALVPEHPPHVAAVLLHTPDHGGVQAAVRSLGQGIGIPVIGQIGGAVGAADQPLGNAGVFLHGETEGKTRPDADCHGLVAAAQEVVDFKMRVTQIVQRFFGGSPLVGEIEGSDVLAGCEMIVLRRHMAQALHVGLPGQNPDVAHIDRFKD